MTSHTRVNVNTAHLIPTAAVWQSPQILRALVNSLFKLSILLMVLGFVGYQLADSPIFNRRKQAMLDKYRLCVANYMLSSEYTYYGRFNADQRCHAIAEREYILNKTR